jgi:hypothetical protein
MNDDPIIVKPHIKDKAGNETHTDIAQVGLYNATVSIVNSERNAVWQRYSAMLIANSIVFGFLAKQSVDQTSFIIPGSILGIMLCFFWWLLTEDGWKFFNIYSEQATRFKWPKLGDDDINLNKVMAEEFNRVTNEGRFKFINKFSKGDRIKTLSFAVILLFVVFYTYFLLSTILKSLLN